MNRRNRVVGTAFAALALLLAGCAVNPGVRQIQTPEASLIFGYFDMEKSPYALRTVFLTQNEKAGIVYRQSAMRTFTDGLFFMEDLPPMQYHVPFFMAGNMRHILSSSEEDLFGVPPGTMVFLGSFEYVTSDEGGILTGEKFEMRPVKKPTEAEVLRMVAKRLEDPRWQERIAQRLKQLGR